MKAKLSMPVFAILLLLPVCVEAQKETSKKSKVDHGANFFRSKADTAFVRGRRSFGAAAIDVNNDGFPDLYFNDMFDGPNELYLNGGMGDFANIRAHALTTDTGPATGQAWADYDNDGDFDVFITYQNKQGNTFFRNDGAGAFEKMHVEGLTTDKGFSFHPAWGDLNDDGYPDLIVCNNSYFADKSETGFFLYQNDCKGGFLPLADSVLCRLKVSSSSSNFCDYDQDGDDDLLISTWGSGVHLARNEGSGRFALISNEFSEATGNFTSCSWVDFDSDGDFDIFLTRGHPDKEKCMLYRNLGGHFSAVKGKVLLDVEGRIWNSGWGDYDNDGDLDVSFSDLGERNFFFENEGEGNFRRIDAKNIVSDSLTRFACATLWTDYDDDGDLDLVLANVGEGQNLLYENEGNRNHWLKFECTGSPSNRSAIGTTIRVKATIGGKETWQVRQVASVEAFRTVNPAVHFGMGDAKRADIVEITWPSGETQTLTKVRVNERVKISQDKN